MTMPQNSPTLVGPYELLRELGDGASSTVFLARHTQLGREVALTATSPLAPELATRFVDGVRPAATLMHPNIAVTHDAFVDAGAAYIAQEYLPGSPLRGEQLSLPQQAGVLEAVRDAVWDGWEQVCGGKRGSEEEVYGLVRGGHFTLGILASGRTPASTVGL